MVIVLDLILVSKLAVVVYADVTFQYGSNGVMRILDRTFSDMVTILTNWWMAPSQLTSLAVWSLLEYNALLLPPCRRIFLDTP